MTRRSTRRGWAKAAAPLLLLAACGVPPGVEVRHVASTRVAEGGGRWHLFLFDPAEPRDLDQRIRMAKAEIARDRDCRWMDAPREMIEAETARQGGPRADTLLAAPVSCA